MIKVEHFVNELMSSNCYIVYDNLSNHCIVVDPGSQHSNREIDFIENNDLILDYIILTHEHTDHTWGCNALLDKYNGAKVVCSQDCAKELPIAGDMYFRLYYDDTNYHYEVKRVDVVLEDVDYKLHWNSEVVEFISTPGHSIGSVCFNLGNYLFTGDTLMLYKPFFQKKKGSAETHKQSVDNLKKTFFNKNMMVCPGHGEKFLLDSKNDD